MRKASPGQGQRGGYTEMGTRTLCHTAEGRSPEEEGSMPLTVEKRCLGGQGYATAGVLGGSMSSAILLDPKVRKK